MTRYVRLADHLRASGCDVVTMQFAELEAVLGAPLPPSARRHRGWWSNNPSNSGATRVWLAAGYRTADVDMAGERLVFRRERAAPMRPSPSVAPDAEADTPDMTEHKPMPEPALALHEAAAPFGQAPSTAAPPGGPHPLFGRMRGALRVLAGVDVAVPADPGWGEDAGRPG
jgi:hypothetical protein